MKMFLPAERMLTQHIMQDGCRSLVHLNIGQDQGGMNVLTQVGHNAVFPEPIRGGPR